MAKVFWRNKRRSEIVHRVGSWVELALLEAFWLSVTPLSARAASALGRRLVGWLGPRTRKNYKVLANLQMAFPERSEQEIAGLARLVWENFGALLAEYPHLGSICDQERLDPAIEIVCENRDPAFLNHERPCIFFAAHMGNVDLSAFAIQHFGYPIDVVYSPQSNALVERAIQRRRGPLRCGYIGKENALRNMYKTLKGGKSVGLHVDVRVEGGEGYPFFGVNAPTTVAPAWLAWKTGYDLVPVKTLRLGDARFRTTLYPALARPKTRDEREAIRTLTEDVNRMIESLITATPGQWWCGKRRWEKPVMAARGLRSR
jgi:KDO2-lipid IV(A) lauroyltransferase